MTDAPLTPNFARRLIVSVLTEAGVPLKRDELAKRVLERHLKEGGTRGQQSPQMIVKKALGYLREDNKVEKADGFGRWRLLIKNGDLQGPSISNEEFQESLEDEDDPYDQTIVPDGVQLEPKKLGSGSESVYLYYHPNDYELAQLKGQNAWECKIGKTENADPIKRIFGQGAKTARSRPPVIALILLTDDCAALERALHASLRLLDAQVDSEGQEWFTTSPHRIELWYLKYQESLAVLRGP